MEKFNLDNLKEDIFCLKSEKDRISSNLKEKLSILFRKCMEDFFNKNPKIQSVSWNQYTPYFNDGDELVFRSNTDYLDINGENIDECKWYADKLITSHGKWDQATRSYVGRVMSSNPSYDEEMAQGVNEVRKIFKQFDNDFFLEEFGDHITVEVTSKGINTKSYDHE